MALTSESALRKDKTNAGNATFEHRHFATIAAILAGMPDHAASLRACKQSCINTFAAELAHTNPRFDCARFLRACGEVQS